MNHLKPNFAFFGTSEYSVQTLDVLKHAGLLPTLIITTPDKPAGKKLELTPSPVKVWSTENNIPFIQPEKLKTEEVIQKLKAGHFDVFIVIAYGKIIPKEILDIPSHGALNIHASLLPKLRGASPIESAILTDKKNTGVTIMLIDEEMDHGPILAQEEVVVEPWPPKAHELGHKLVEAGSHLLIEMVPKWLKGEIIPLPQDHTQATYTEKIQKNDGLIDLAADPYQNFRKIQAFSVWPRTFFFVERNNQKIRVIITEAEFKNGMLNILKVIPEGKKEMNYSDFARSL
jgi:methionyl-tRNA formyltransferase